MSGRSTGDDFAATLLLDSLEELQTALGELRGTEGELRAQQVQLARALDAAEASSSWNRALFENASDPLLVTDPDGVVHDANTAAGAMLGMDPQVLRGKPLEVFIPLKERLAFRGRLATLRDEALPTRLELRMQPWLAVPVQVEASLTAFSPRDTTPALLWMLHDVTALRQAEAGRAEAAGARLRALRMLPVPTVLLDVDGTVALWNAAAAALLGFREEETTGRATPCWGRAVEQTLDTALDAR
ncbi:MAG TPA: PAS domain-containing protein, partial [Longimicrobium sp.]|nr:PAS domain-containing protein [Longimicrobium sp.]